MGCRLGAAEFRSGLANFLKGASSSFSFVGLHKPNHN